jgi:hypothetical protein
MRLRLAVLVLTTTPVLALTQQSAPKQDSPVSYCDLAREYAKYDHKIVRMTGIYRRGGEISSFYDPGCIDADSAWVDSLPGLKHQSSPDLVSTMEALLDAHGRAMIDAEVEFDGPKPVTIPPGTSPRLAEIIRYTNSRYGHENLFRFRVVLLRLRSVEPVPSATPWPRVTPE